MGNSVKIVNGAGTLLKEVPGDSLRGADLGGANLRGADLGGANLRGANLRGAEGVIGVGSPDGWPAWVWRNAAGRLVIRVGCRELSLATARTYWADKPDRREVLAAVEYMATVAVLRGWTTDVKEGARGNGE